MPVPQQEYPQKFANHIAVAEQTSPQKGLVAIEQEFVLHPPEKRGEHEDWYRDRLVVQGEPENPDVQRNRQQLETAGREAARSLVKGLKPTNDEERERQKDWVDNVDSWHLGDLINFELYSGLSEASLKSGDNQTATYYDLLAASAKSPLEFRFGNGIFQSGYYDNPGMSEVRIAPTTPVEALARRAVLITKLSSLATRYGVDLGMHNNPHINMSLFEQGDDSGMKPVLCLDTPDGQERIRMAVSGVAALFLDGMGHSPKSDELIEKYGSEGGTMGNELSARMKKQSSLRIIPGRLELRSGFGASGAYGMGTTSQRMFMLLAGAQLGLDPAMQEQLAAYPQAEIVERPLFIRDESYAKDSDLHLLRALEHVNYRKDEDGGLKPISEEFDFFWMMNGDAYLSEMLGADKHSIENMGSSDVVGEGLFSTLIVKPSGDIVSDPEAYIAWWNGLDEAKKEALGQLGMNGGSAALVTERHRPIKMSGTVKTIEHHVKLSDRTWDDFVKRVSNSPLVAKVMGSNGHKAFAEWLNSTGHPAFNLHP